MPVRTVTIERQKRGFWVQTYIPEIVKGMGVTIKAMFGTLAQPKQHLFTIQYPDEKREYPHRFRGQHRLMLREDGQVRCVACMCCSTICPAECIHIVAGEHDDPNIEKYPRVFVIDMLRCIVCGLCVEACPCDAIRMDTGEHTEPFVLRDAAFKDRDLMMARNKGNHSTAVQGGVR